MQNVVGNPLPPADSRLLRLCPADNVLVAIATIEAGEELLIGGGWMRVAVKLPLGHKLAACEIAPGEKIIKYGVSIGSATTPIEIGAHVHTHNMKSDYLPTYTLNEQSEYFKDHH